MFRQLVTRSVQRGARPRFFAAQGKEAYLFGVKPGTYQYEGWEGIVYTTYAASALLLTVGLYSRPGIDIKTWAADEAAARKAVKEQGGEVKWGVHYGGSKKYSFEKAGVGEVPTNESE
mmetsp:Transcript_75328/g.151457  ORF Transcript_75328/g.151457 Transcript_75328/m.151457 type:complete len:118 (+) Transcript_75328:35-388(+)